MIDYAASLADPVLVTIWHPIQQVLLERALWCQVMRNQRRVRPDLISIEELNASRHAANIAPHLYDEVLFRIEQRERQTRHDLKARLEIFCEDAGHERAHIGMTSADVVENVMQIRVRDSLADLQIRYGTEASVDAFIQAYPFRGITGPMGTSQDQLDILGSPEEVQNLNERICYAFGFYRLLGSAGQVLPRSLDSQLASVVHAWVIRRAVNSQWRAAVSGYASMLHEISGGQWNEGDVSTSVVRRVAIPGLLICADLALGDKP